MGNLSIQTFISFAGVGAIATALQYILLTLQVELINVGAVGFFYCLRDQFDRELPDEVSLCVFIATTAPQNDSPLSGNFEHWLGAEYAADVYRR